MRDAVAARALDLVLVTAPDRLARNYVHQMVLLEELERNGCRVEFLERPMSQDPHDQLLLQIRGAVAEYERTLIAEGRRMRRGRLRKLQAGVLLPWTRPPYGYRLGLDRPRDPAAVWVEPAEAAIVREIFARYLETTGSLAGLAKYLSAQGIATPMGKAFWSASSVHGILTNPTYTGQIYAGRTRTRPARVRHSALQPIGPHQESATQVASAGWLPVAPIPPLVSQEQFDQVQAKLAHNRQFARRHNTAHRYLLRALVSCGECRPGLHGTQRPSRLRLLSLPRQSASDPVGARPASALRGTSLPTNWMRSSGRISATCCCIRTVLLRRWSGPTVAIGLPQELQARHEQLRRASAERDWPNRTADARPISQRSCRSPNITGAA